MFEKLIDQLVDALFGFGSESHFGGIVHFFIYDSVKILFLLAFMIAFLGFLRTYLPQERMKHWLAQKKGLANFYASLFGAVTPFCSCSSIPIFLGFMNMGIPLGAAFSFLITSPLINEYLVVLMLGFFGWKITAAYIASGMLTGIVVGLLLGKMGLEKYLEKDLIMTDAEGREEVSRSFWSRISFGVREAAKILKRLWLWVLLGVGMGALIHNFIPEESIQSVISKTGFFSVPLATLIGVPLYGSCAAIVPVAVVLFQKGVPLGTALAFMMAVSALSLPEAVLLRRAMKLPLVLMFFGITTLGIIVTGYLFNLLQPLLS